MVEGKSCSGTCACASDKKAEGGYDWPMNYPSRASQSKRTPSREAGYDYCLICGDNGDDGKQMTEGFRPQSSMCDLHGCTCEDCFCHDCLREKTTSTNRNVIHKPCACASDKKAETFMPPVHKDECTVCVGFADLKDLGPDYEVFLLCEDCITKAKTMPRHYSAESFGGKEYTAYTADEIRNEAPTMTREEAEHAQWVCQVDMATWEDALETVNWRLEELADDEEDWDAESFEPTICADCGKDEEESDEEYLGYCIRCNVNRCYDGMCGAMYELEVGEQDPNGKCYCLFKPGSRTRCEKGQCESGNLTCDLCITDDEYAAMTKRLWEAESSSAEITKSDLLPIGAKVRSYDFWPKKTCYIEGVIEKMAPSPSCSPNCMHYHIRRTKTVWQGKEVAEDRIGEIFMVHPYEDSWFADYPGQLTKGVQLMDDIKEAESFEAEVRRVRLWRCEGCQRTYYLKDDAIGCCWDKNAESFSADAVKSSKWECGKCGADFDEEEEAEECCPCQHKNWEWIDVGGDLSYAEVECLDCDARGMHSLHIIEGWDAEEIWVKNAEGNLLGPLSEAEWSYLKYETEDNWAGEAITEMALWDEEDEGADEDAIAHYTANFNNENYLAEYMAEPRKGGASRFMDPKQVIDLVRCSLAPPCERG